MPASGPAAGSERAVGERGSDAAARTVALAEAAWLARIRHENGLISQLEAIDADRNLLQAELNRSDALRSQRAAVADLVKALGGGWAGFVPSPLAQGAAGRP